MNYLVTVLHDVLKLHFLDVGNWECLFDFGVNCSSKILEFAVKNLLQSVTRLFFNMMIIVIVS